MADSHPTDKVREASINIEPARNQWLVDLGQFLEAETALSESALMGPWKDTFPDYIPSYTLEEQLALRITDGIWDLRRQQEHRFDPLLSLGDDIMHEILLYVVNLEDNAESRVWETEFTPGNHTSGPLVLTNVNRRWNQFITSSPQLWSHLLIDTDEDDALAYLQLFLLLSCDIHLFIALRGHAVVRDAIVTALLRVGDRINALVYPPNVSPSTLTKFRLYLEPTRCHLQLGPICPWYQLEVRSQQHTDRYSFPGSVQILWMDGLFPLSNPNLVTLSHFQSLSFLSVRLGHDTGVSPVAKSRLELPILKILRLQMALASDRQIETSISVICQRLKLLHLRCTLELNLDNIQEYPASWLEFGAIVALEELRIRLEIHVVTNAGANRWLALRREAARVRESLQRLERQLEEMEIPAYQGQYQDQDQDQDQDPYQYLYQERQAPQRPQEVQQRREAQQAQGEVLQARQALQRVELQNYILFIWRRWVKPLENIRQSSLEVRLSTDQEEYGFVRNTIEESIMFEMPRLIELTTSNILQVFPKHLQKLCVYGFSIPDSGSLINLPSLLSLEIKADGFLHLSILRYIRVPQLRELWVQVLNSTGDLHEHDWRDTTSNLLDRISLRFGMHDPKRGDSVIVFHLPPTHSLNIFSPSRQLCLYLAEPPLSSYTLHADIQTVLRPLKGRSDQISAAWRENVMTVYIHSPPGILTLTKFQQLVSLRQIVLDRRQYKLSKQSPTDELFNILAKNVDVCPHLSSVTLAQCPSCWPSFLHDLRKRNQAFLLSNATKCIEALSFYQPLHATIIGWLTDAIKARSFKVTERPPAREGDAWPKRPFRERGRVFRSCYICYITGMELGCLEYETQSADCGRERGDGLMIRAL